MVGECRYRNGEIRCHASLRRPEISQVFAMCSEGKAWQPGSIEPSGTDHNVDFMLIPILIQETLLSELVDCVSEDRSVRSDKSFQIARRRSRSTAARIEVFGDDLIAKSFIVVHLASHLFVGELSRRLGFLRSFNDELEPLVQLVFDLLAVFQVFLWVLLQVL